MKEKKKKASVPGLRYPLSSKESLSKIQSERERELLLNISCELAAVRNRRELVNVIKNSLQQLFYFNDLALPLFNEDRETFTSFLEDFDSDIFSHPDYNDLVTRTHPIRDGLVETALESDLPIVIDIENLMKNSDVPLYIKVSHEMGYKEMAMTRLSRGNDQIGVLLLNTDKFGCFDENSLSKIWRLSKHISTAVLNILANEAAEKRETEMVTMLSINEDIAAVRDKADLLQVIHDKLKRLFSFDDVIIGITNDDKETHSALLLDVSHERSRNEDFEEIAKTKYPINDGIYSTILEKNEPVIFNVEELYNRTEKPGYVNFLYKTGVKEVVSMALREGEHKIGAFSLQLNEHNTFQQSHLNFIKGISNQLSIAVANIIANEKIKNQIKEIKKYKQQLEKENIYLQEEINTKYNCFDIIGSGIEMQGVFNLISQVAFTNSTVLLQGETGTGKELIARAIHSSSSRADKVMVKVNCAALPADLVESELFGHERGSFTGATERRIGKFELADHSTLFLDEIGEMPLDLQVKLLRAIQEKEIERVGGNATIKTDIRIIAATNRNLMRDVETGHFRRDLYYRLNVFPIMIPALRDRTEDIPALTHHFIERFSQSTGKKLTGITQAAMQQLIAYNWPGNVRELENIIERSVLLASGPTIKEVFLPQNDRKLSANGTEIKRVKTIEENERDHILAVLKKCKGKISGVGGAAEILGVPPSTLTSKLKKLNIDKKHFYSSK